MPTLTQLEYLVAVNKHKHFGRAAKECHVSQPSLSAQIQKLEEELDIIVFDRSKKPILTTEQGKAVVSQAQKILRESERLYDIKAEGETIRGHFHLGVIPTLSPYLVPLFVESFSKKYPEVQLKISEYKTEDIIRKLYDDDLDGGLLVTPLKDDKIIERSLFFEPFYAFVSSDHPYYKRSSLDGQALEEDDIWLLQEGHCFRNQVISMRNFEKRNKVLNNIQFESGSLETIKNLIRKGKGYTLLPHLAIFNLTRGERDKNVKKFKKPQPTREVSLVHSRSFLKEDIIDALICEILDNLPKELKSLKKGNIDIIDID